jgi:hypothetical protein
VAVRHLGAEAEVGVHDHLVGVAGERVGGEQDARRIGRDHRLDHDTHADRFGIAERRAVAQRSGRQEARPGLPHGARQR